MAEDAKAVAEIHAAVGEWQSIERSFVKAYVGLACEFPFAMAEPRRHLCGPPPAAGIETHGMLREALPGKDCEILFEQPQ